MPHRKTLLAVFAHPDDEAFGVGGTLARYAARGVRVVLACATRGEAGQISDPSLATPENLGRVREEELRCAARALGVREVIFLGYRDSGMAGDRRNADPRAYVNAPDREVVGRLTALIRRLRPGAVITFEPDGGYGHPDHIAVSRHTTAAVRAAADPRAYPEAGPAWNGARLFYTALPRPFFRGLADLLRRRGIESEWVSGRDPETLGLPEEAITHWIDVEGFVEAKWAALRCHRTQLGPNHLFFRLPEEEILPLLAREAFTLAWPEGAEQGTELL